MVFHLGTCFEQNAKMSVMIRIDGRGGKMYSFCAMNSLRMSFWIVPESVFQLAPCLSATTRYIAKIIAAGEQQRLVAFVGFFRRPEPGELAHRPELAAVAGRVNAAGIRELAGLRDI